MATGRRRGEWRVESGAWSGGRCWGHGRLAPGETPRRRVRRQAANPAAASSPASSAAIHHQAPGKLPPHPSRTAPLRLRLRSRSHSHSTGLRIMSLLYGTGGAAAALGVVGLCRFTRRRAPALANGPQTCSSTARARPSTSAPSSKL
jgi:hypothetical protein